jgi:hypothetical protein
MENTLSKFIAILLVVTLLFIFPVLNMFDNQDNISRTIVLNEVTGFVDAVRNLGYITPRMYEDLLKKLQATGNRYVIELTHEHLVVQPVYSDVTDLSTFENTAKNTYNNSYSKEILEVLYSDEEDSNYYLSSGDYFVMKVYNDNRTIATRLKSIVLGSQLPEKNIVVNYGGMVKNENY